MRQGTMITVSECHFACVNAEIYERLMKKDKQVEIDGTVAFTRQISYISEWRAKDIISLIYKFVPITLHRGQILV